MTKSRLSLKSLARTGLSLLFAGTILSCGCSTSTSPTYLKENIEKGITDICKNEYKIDVTVKLVGSTLWIYLPVEEIVSNQKPTKPEKYVERFEIKENSADFKNGFLRLDYKIKAVPEKEKTQEFSYNKNVAEKLDKVWKVLRRVVFSMKDAPKFYFLVVADTKYGFETEEVFYIQDLKKVSYEFISITEYQHRSIQDSQVATEIIGDTLGKHLKYRDISMGDFIALQIQHRVRLKFQKPEVESGVDIEQEILKITAHTINIYGFKDFKGLEMYNGWTQNRAILNRPAVIAKFNE